MFNALFSRLRLPSANDQTHDDGDDASSVNRSLNLPWPVTESSARRPSISAPARRDLSTAAAGGQPLAHGAGTTSLSNGLVISGPIPRSHTSSLTGFSDYHTASSGSARSASPTHAPGRPPRASQPQAVPWYEHERTRKLMQRAGAAQGFGGNTSQYAPPQVVRLDSDAIIPDTRNEDGEDSPPPMYVARQSATEAQYLSRGVPSNSNIQGLVQASQPRYSTHGDNQSENSEFYASPFDSDPEEVTPTQARYTPNSNTSSVTSLSQFPKPPGATMPKAKWNLKLQLHGVPQGVTTTGPRGTGEPHLRDTDQHLSLEDPNGQGAGYRTPGSSLQVGSGIETDVYKNAYNYPHAVQLSPIPEKDYFSPTVESPGVQLVRNASNNGNLQKPSPGNESLASLILTTKDVAEKEPPKQRNGAGRSGSGGSVATVNGSDITRPSPIYSSPFLTRQLNRTVSQSSSRSDSQSQHLTTPAHTQPPTPITAQTPVQTQPAGTRPILGMAHVSTAVPRATGPSIPPGLKEVVATPTSAGTSATTATNGTIYHTPTSTQQTPTATGTSPITPSQLAGTTPVTPTAAPAVPAITLTSPSDTSSPTLVGTPKGFPKIPSLPSIGGMDWRSSVFGSVAPRASREVRLSAAENARKGITGDVHRMPAIDGSGEAEHEDDDEDEEGEEIEEGMDDDDYDHESLHAASFVTAGTNDDHEQVEKGKSVGHDEEEGFELSTMNGRSLAAGKAPQRGASPNASVANESFIDRRWERDGALSSSPTTTKRHSPRWPVHFSKPKSHPSPAFWTFWFGFIFPVLWLIGGWHFTNIGELPPRVTILEWYFWNSTWGISACLQGLSYRLFGCCLRNKAPGAGQKLKKTHKKQGSEDSTASNMSQTPRQRRKGKYRSGSQAAIRTGQVYPALPRWVADKQSSDDGRMRLNDPKRSLRGISFGYPFIARPMNSQDSSHPAPPSSTLRRIICSPNRVLDLLYGVKLQEVCGRPESGRRMFDPWIQRCRYALCYALILVGAGLCTASVYLIAINTRKMDS